MNDVGCRMYLSLMMLYSKKRCEISNLGQLDPFKYKMGVNIGDWLRFNCSGDAF